MIVAQHGEVRQIQDTDDEQIVGNQGHDKEIKNEEYTQGDRDHEILDREHTADGSVEEDVANKATADILRDIFMNALNDNKDDGDYATEHGNDIDQDVDTADFEALVKDIRSQHKEGDMDDILVVTKYGEEVRIEKIVLDAEGINDFTNLNLENIDKSTSEGNAEVVKQLLESVLTGLDVGDDIQVREYEVDLTNGQASVVELADAEYASGGFLTLAFGGPIAPELSDTKPNPDPEVKPVALVTDISSSLRFRIEYTANSEPETETCGGLYTPGNLDGNRVMCCLPSQREEEKDDPNTNVKPEEIIGSLNGTCIDYEDGFWSYEFCVGGSLRQFLKSQRDDPEIKIKHDYILGTHNNTPATKAEVTSSIQATAADTDALSGETSEKEELPPPLLHWNGLRFPYHEWKYDDGTICDVTGNPRKTSVRFVCVQGVPEMTMLTLSESVTCVYTAIVAVPELCAHEQFRTSSGNYYELKCYLPNEGESFEAVRNSAKRRAASMSTPHITNWGLPKVMPADWKDPLTPRQRGLTPDDNIPYQKIGTEMILDLLKDLQTHKQV